MNDWNRLDRHIVSAESIGSFKRRLDESMDRDDKYLNNPVFILDYSKGGGQGTASCRSLTGLLQSPHFLCSYVLMIVTPLYHCIQSVGQKRMPVTLSDLRWQSLHTYSVFS